MKNKVFFGLGGAVIGTVFAVFFFPVESNKRDILACTTEFNFTRNMGESSEVKVSAIAQFYFYQDGTGLTTYKGAAASKDHDMIVDRDVDFTWERQANDNLMVLTYKNTLRRHNDNTPDMQWGCFARPGARYFLTISELSPAVWLIQDRRYPIFICRGD
ncbi:hypothetical protein [Klebsiella aerogenes]|uniref:hypothetical protein n=1 Tax=Klebsiella aerogenes TaxID=548 RepID=UPI001867C382|nr:hypothetical protein [Klebsiella aerogenes]